VDIMPQNPTELLGDNNLVEVASNRDLLATFDVVNPSSVQFPQLWSLSVWILDGNQAPCIYMLTSVGIGFYGTGVPAAADMVLEQFEASKHLTAPGSINLIGVRVLDGNSWLSVNGEEIGPYPCQTWSGTGWIGVGATSDLDTSPGKVEFNQFTVWAPDE